MFTKKVAKQIGEKSIELNVINIPAGVVLPAQENTKGKKNHQWKWHMKTMEL